MSHFKFYSAHHLKLEEYDVVYEADLIKAKPKAEEVAG